ncbi:MAG: DUF2325 domain-containing protein [Clostridia bacterium]|nr:DUF2325 domain-containing protein [Clostridia bacterium]
MCLFLVGGDRLGNINRNLLEWGFTEIVHIDGRKSPSPKQITIPAKTDAVVVLTDFINHNTCEIIKKQAKERDIPIVFSKRSWACLACKLRTISC